MCIKKGDFLVGEGGMTEISIDKKFDLTKI